MTASPITTAYLDLSPDIRARAEELEEEFWSQTVPQGSEVTVAGFIARAIQAERERDRWQPIETAPRDGTRILLRLSNGEVFSGWGTEEAGFQKFHADGTDIGWLNPRHWQPLPSPPSGGDE